jgi:hypothetical protein
MFNSKVRHGECGRILSFTSLWSQFRLIVAELLSNRGMLITSRIWQKATPHKSDVLTFYPATPAQGFVNRTPRLPRIFPRSYD